MIFWRDVLFAYYFGSFLSFTLLIQPYTNSIRNLRHDPTLSSDISPQTSKMRCMTLFSFLS